MGVIKEYEGLAKVTDVSIDDLADVSTNIRKYIKTEDDNVLQLIKDKLKDHPGPIGFLFPSKTKKEIEALTIQQMRDVFKNRQNLYSVYVNTKFALAQKAGEALLQSMHLQCKGGLIKIAIKTHEELSILIQDSIKKVGDKSEESKAEFAAKIDRQIEDAEKYKHRPYLYQRYQRSIDHETESSFDIFDKIVDGYQEALKLQFDEAQKKLTVE